MFTPGNVLKSAAILALWRTLLEASTLTGQEIAGMKIWELWSKLLVSDWIG